MLSVMILYKINMCPVNAINGTDINFIQITMNDEEGWRLRGYFDPDQLPPGECTDG